MMEATLAISLVKQMIERGADELFTVKEQLLDWRAACTQASKLGFTSVSDALEYIQKNLNEGVIDGGTGNTTGSI